MGDIDATFIAGYLSGAIDTGYDPGIDALIQTGALETNEQDGLLLILTEGPGVTPRKFRITVEEIN